MQPSRRRRASIRSGAHTGLSHLDLENLVVALLAADGTSWPNALYTLGYRLRSLDVRYDLIDGAAAVGKQHSQVHPDAIAYHAPRNLSLIIECKTGRDAGLGQLPEGMPATADQWADALAVPRGTVVVPQVRGMLVADPESLEPKSAEIERIGTSWLRASERTFELRPDNVGDPRLGGAIAGLPPLDWPRSFIPFGHDPTDGVERVVSAIGPLILQAASRGEDSVTAEDLAQTTHHAVWSVTSPERHRSWVTAVSGALNSLATGPMKRTASFDKPMGRLRLRDVHAGIPASHRVLRAISQAIAQEQRRTQRARARVASKRTPPPQLVLWEDDLL